MDRVLYRVYPDGDVLAVLPDQDANPGRVVCYQHFGQHGEGDYWVILRTTRPAREGEARELAQELKRLGYELRVCKRLRRKED